MASDLVLDCRGMRCPRPIVEMAKAMRRMGAGQVLELLATDPVAKK
ncbi:MAG: sulfurtransferase TusA family protein, partial [Dehalococcoidia bacterium]